MKKRPPYRPRNKATTPFGFWLDGCGISVIEVARKLGVSTMHIYNLRSGNTRPGREIAAAIELLTGGAVSVSSW